MKIAKNHEKKQTFTVNIYIKKNHKIGARTSNSTKCLQILQYTDVELL